MISPVPVLSLPSLSPIFQAQTETGSYPVWLIIAIVLVIFALALYWWTPRPVAEAVGEVQPIEEIVDDSAALVEEAVEPAAAPEPEGVVVAETVTEATTPAEPAAAVEAPPAEEKEPVKAPAAKPTAKGDDLRRIVGVGPRVVAQFQRLGITTYAQLAALDVDELRTTLDDAGLLRLADPGTWPEQAQLAAAGQWDELEALQATLNFKGVRLS